VSDVAHSAAAGRRRRPRSVRRPSPVVVLAGAVALLAVLPIALVVGQTLSGGRSEAERLLLRPLVGTLLLHTAALTATATAAATALGLAVAWLVERTDLPFRKLWAALAALPITVPAFVTSYSWVTLTPAVEGFWGAVLIVTLAYYPLVYLPVAAVLRRMDPALEESARSLGLGPWRTFLRVTLPQTRPALLGGALIVAIHLLTEFGAFAMLRFRTFTTAIYDEYRLSFDGPAASALASVLVAICLVLLVVELNVRGHAPHVRVGTGSRRPLSRRRLGRWTPLALAGFVALLVVSLALPVGTLVYWIAREPAAMPALGSLASAAATSLGLALAAAALTTLLALPIAFVSVRRPGRISTVLERSAYLAYALPGITIALALIIVSIRYVRPLYQTTPLLVLAYALLSMPLALVATRAALAQAPVQLEQVSRSLGHRPWKTFVRVTLPLILPGLGAAAALVFLATITELTATLLLAPIGMETLATAFWGSTRSLAYAQAAPYALCMIVLSAPPAYLLTRKLGSRGAGALS
jgi:iron(III) transport system permease protein